MLTLFIAATRLLTLEADEANILLGAYNVFGIPVPQASAAAYPTVTSGGLFPLIHGLLGLLTTDIGVHRAVSVVVVVVFVVATFWLLREMRVSRSLAMAGAAMSAATPGLLLVGSLAMAEVMATLLLLFGTLLWVRAGRRSAAGAVLAGLLFGMACATRFNAIFIFPALLIYALDFETGWRRKLLYPGLATVTGVFLLLAATQLYYLAAGTEAAGNIGTLTGASMGKDIFSFARYLLIANDWLPLWVIAAIAGTYVAAGRYVLRRRDRQLTALLLLAGGFGWLMWIFKAPIPHVRYLWPAMPCLWLGAIIVATTLIERARNQSARTAYHISALVACFYQVLTGSYIMSQGDSLVMAYKLNRTSAFVDKVPSWTAAADQKALAGVVQKLPSSAELYTINRNSAFPITYLSGRAVATLEGASFTDKPAYLLALPVDYALWRPTNEILSWRERNAIEIWRRGDFVLYRIRPHAPTPPLQRQMIGANDIYPSRP
ncbi:glycosyltransferase family 39 protein [Sphingomonas sp. LHG3443-2]|uniref:glycosyltransferase family 39 protein n=1 Tax=Sphingomonas sp. LHG3443-2 TaxID=2804639 RepID=UPI003CE7DA6F